MTEEDDENRALVNRAKGEAIELAKREIEDIKDMFNMAVACLFSFTLAIALGCYAFNY